MEVIDVHEKILYPVTRVRASDSGGSGVIIYSEPDPEHEGQYINIALTCQHVVDKNIVVKDEWGTVLKREIKRDVTSECTIEMFDYDGSKIVSANSIKAQIIAYDKNHDLAAVKLNSTRPIKHVSTVIPKDEIDDLRIAAPVWVCGCATRLQSMADRKDLWPCLPVHPARSQTESYAPRIPHPPILAGRCVLRIRPATLYGTAQSRFCNRCIPRLVGRIVPCRGEIRHSRVPGQPA